MTKQIKDISLRKNKDMFREAILLALEETKTTQREVANAIGVMPQNFNTYLKGGTLPINDIEKALEYLNLTISKKKKHTVTAVIDGNEVDIEIKKINLEL